MSDLIQEDTQPTTVANDLPIESNIVPQPAAEKSYHVDSISSLDREPQGQIDMTQLQDEESLATRLARATSLKDTAKPFVKGGLYEDAIRIYETAFYTLKPTAQDRSSPDFKKSLNFQNDLFNNLSYCYSQIERYQEAISYAKRVLIIDRDNVKALYRLAVCYKNLGDYVSAYENIEKCQEAFRLQNPDQPLDPKIRELEATLKEKCKAIFEERERKERELYVKMMGQQKPSYPQEVEKTEKEPEPKKSIFSYRIVRFGIGMGLTGLVGYIMYRAAKKKAEEAARRMLPALILAVGALACLKYVKGNVRSSLFGLGLGILATLIVQKSNKKNNWF